MLQADSAGQQRLWLSAVQSSIASAFSQAPPPGPTQVRPPPLPQKACPKISSRSVRISFGNPKNPRPTPKPIGMHKSLWGGRGGLRDPKYLKLFWGGWGGLWDPKVLMGGLWDPKLLRDGYGTPKSLWGAMGPQTVKGELWDPKIIMGGAMRPQNPYWGPMGSQTVKGGLWDPTIH